jgi:hypothetical protein
MYHDSALIKKARENFKSPTRLPDL